VKLDAARWRKASDINREYALFELVVGDIAVLDVGFDDDRRFEIAFNPAIGQIVDHWDRFERLIQEGRALAEADM